MNEKKGSVLRNVLRITGFAVMGLAAAAAFALIFSVAVKYLWNWLMPALFGFPVIGYLQALGLVILARLLVGGWHHGHGEHIKHRKKRDHLHMFMESDYSTIPPEIRMHRREFDRFWETGGKSSFEGFMKDPDKKSPGCD